MIDLSDDERCFLEALTSARIFKLLPAANRAQDRARQACRRKGLAVFNKGLSINGGGWRITDAGRSALKQGGRQP